jgi:hypothetical protein
MVDISFEEDGAMPKYKPYNYSQTVMIPISLEDQLMPGHWSLQSTHWWKTV